MKSNRQSCLGMTVLEIMIVISIIAIVASLLAYAIGQAREKMMVSKAEQDLQRLTAAIQMLEFDTGMWPGHSPRNARMDMFGSALPEIMDLTTPDSGLIEADVAFTNAGWKGPYLDEIPLDPWGRKYFFDPDYRHAQTGEVKAVVGSCGPKYSGANDWDPDNIYVEIVPKLKQP